MRHTKHIHEITESQLEGLLKVIQTSGSQSVGFQKLIKVPKKEKRRADIKCQL